MKIIIGLTGVKTAGKTTAFNYLKEHNPEIVEITLASRLKNACIDCLGIPSANLFDPALKEKPLENFVHLTAEKVTKVIEYFGVKPDFEKHVRHHIGQVFQTGRKAAQYVGTEIMRNVDEDIHCIGATLDLPEDGIFVITDMRFQSEFDYFKNNFTNNFYPLYVSNNTAEFNIEDHPSEKQVLKIAPNCTTIDNNGSLGDLKKNIIDAYENIINSNMLKRRQTCDGLN